MTQLPKMKVRLVSWDDIVSWTKELSKKIKASGWYPDVIIAIARGGFVPARLLCDFLDVIDLLSIKVEHWVETGYHIEHAYVKYPLNVNLEGKRTLIVDDICDTGESFIVAKKHIIENCKPKEVRTAAMQYIPSTAKMEPDYYVDVVREWTWYMYPWNFTEDMVNLTRKIMNSNRSKAWNLEEIKKAFKEAYNLVFDDETFIEIIEEMLRRGKISRVENGYVLK